MDEALIRWQQLPAWTRVALIALVWLSCAAPLQLLLLQPQWRSVQRLQQDLTQLQVHYQSRLHALHENRPLTALQEENRELQEQLKSVTEAASTFELATLLQDSGGSLQKWAPQHEGVELQLQLEWPQLQRLSVWLLARPRPFLPSRWYLKSQGKQLSATFYWFHRHDEI